MKVTFLAGEVPLTKTFSIEDGELKKVGHPKIINYTSHEEEYETLEDLHALMVKHAALGNCMLKGNLSRPLFNESRKSTTDSNATTRLVCFDLDGAMLTLAEFVKLLKIEGIDYIVQYSASCGVVPDCGLRAHVFMLLERPLAAPLLKQIMMQFNLSVPKLRAGLSLSRTNNALRWPLDISTCQNDKLIYIAPPLLGESVEDTFEGERIALAKGTKRFVAFESMPSAELNKKEAHKALNTLREAAGLEKRAMDDYGRTGTIEWMKNPDKCIITEMRSDNGFRRFNLNGGDSWGYYHPENNPEYIFNFKGEPIYRTRDLLPEYWSEVREKVNGPREDENGNLYLVWRNWRTAKYYNGVWFKATNRLDYAEAKGEAQCRSFLKQHGQPVGDYIPVADMVYDPESRVVVDRDAQPRMRINIYQPSEFEGREQVTVTEVPKAVRRVLLHALGGDEVAYEYKLNWLAVALQLKCAVGTAQVLQGVQGTGKGLFLNHILRPLFGDSNVVVKRMSEFDSTFNGFIENALIVWIDDAPKAETFARSPSMDANFKNYICEPIVSIRHMYCEAYQVKNRASYLFSANNDGPVMLPPDDRRFNIGAFQPEKILVDAKFVNELNEAAWPFYCYLMQRAIDREATRHALKNAAKDLMIGINRLAVDGVIDAIKSGDFAFLEDQLPSGPMDALPMYEQAKAASYAALVERIRKGEMDKVTSRDELRIILDYTVGNMPAHPHKFTALLKHHRLHMEQVRRDGKQFKGVHVPWKRGGS